MQSKPEFSFNLQENQCLSIEVISPRAPACNGQVRGVHSDEIRAHFPRVSLLKTPLGTDVSLRFVGTCLKEPVSCEARVLSRRDEDQHREYVFELLKPEEIVPVLLPQIQGVYNRRGAVRIRPRGRTPIYAQLDAGLGVGLQAVVHDISASGLSVRVSPEEEAILAGAAEVEVGVVLPTTPPLEIHLRAAIRERRFAGKQMHLGLAFLAEGSHDFLSQEQALLQFVFAYCAEMQGKRAPTTSWQLELPEE